VLRREGEVGAADGALLLVELRQRMRRVQVVHDVAVDIDELAPVSAARDQMGLPDFFEQGLGHRMLFFSWHGINLPRNVGDCYAGRMGKGLLRDGDVISGAVLSALGLYIFLQAHQWDYSGPDGPGPGFFPTWYGLGMIALSLVMIGQSVRKGAAAAGAIDWRAAVRGFGTWAAFTLSVALYKPLAFTLSLAP